MRRWRARHLLYSWIAYWAILFAVVFAPAIRAHFRILAAPHGKESVSAGFDDDILTLTLSDAASTVYSASVPFFTALLWMLGPPMLIWLLWLALRPREGVVGERVRG